MPTTTNSLSPVKQHWKAKLDDLMQNPQNYSEAEITEIEFNCRRLKLA